MGSFDIVDEKKLKLAPAAQLNPSSQYKYEKEDYHQEHYGSFYKYVTYIKIRMRRNSARPSLEAVSRTDVGS